MRLLTIPPCAALFSGAAFLFVLSQGAYFGLSHKICTGTGAKIDGSLIASILETMAVGVLFAAWRSITEDSWDVSSRILFVWEQRRASHELHWTARFGGARLAPPHCVPRWATPPLNRPSLLPRRAHHLCSFYSFASRPPNRDRISYRAPNLDRATTFRASYTWTSN